MNAIKVEDVSKKYELGTIGAGTLYHTLWGYLDRLKGGRKEAALKEKNEFWALRDINFEVADGEVVGIVGRNGAGKSTLLKVISRITEPTTGRITINGRVASLLEVGTGFHSELSGRENIYLNGSILGMTRAEIRRKFDEIVEFSGVAKFLDTPVKRYSSGMYVRLAFAVAAHLEPEILIIDEVLSVGDAEFQKKCIGKMSDVAKSGRTVLFVSHNMAAVRQLCTKAILLDKGRILSHKPVDAIIDEYLSLGLGEENLKFTCATKHGDCVVSIYNQHRQPTLNFQIGDGLILEFEFKGHREFPSGNIGVGINNTFGGRVVTYHTYYELSGGIPIKEGTTIRCEVDALALMNGRYNVEISLFDYGKSTYFNVSSAFIINVETADYFGTGKLPDAKYQGVMVQRSKWGIV